jgi:hypothetical protein
MNAKITIKFPSVIAFLAAMILMPSVLFSATEVNYVWNNSSADMALASSWNVLSTGEVSTKVPGKDDIVWFEGFPEKQPYLSESMTFNSMRFGNTSNSTLSKFYTDKLNNGGYSHCGWVISGADGAVLTLTRKANLGQSENNQCVIASLSFGTNTIAVPVSFSSEDLKLEANGGILDFAAPLFSVASGSLRLMDTHAEDDNKVVHNGAVRFSAANPDFHLNLLLNNASFCIGHPEALSGVSVMEFTSSIGGSKEFYLENATDEEITLHSIKSLVHYKCENTNFRGKSMHFPNAVWRADPSYARDFYAESPLYIGSISNVVTTVGYKSVIHWFGPSTLHVLGDFCAGAPEGQTNVIKVLDGTVLFEDISQASKLRFAIGSKGTNSRRPRVGVIADRIIPIEPRGFPEGGEVYYRENCYYAGWAAYGGDYKVTFGSPDATIYLMGAKYFTENIVKAAQWSGLDDWYFSFRNFIFGAKDSDGTITIANPLIDVNQHDGGWGSWWFHAFQGKAFVSGRIAGDIYDGEGYSVATYFNKTGGGVVALDGTISGITGTCNIKEGGLLFNGSSASSPFSVDSGAWIGGTGTIAKEINCASGGGIRPGEGGGTLMVDGNLVMADGAKMLVDLNPGHYSGTCKFTPNASLKQSGSIVFAVDGVFDERYPKYGTIKMIDWTDNANVAAAFKLDSCSVEYDHNVFRVASLIRKSDGVYLRYSFLADRSFIIKLR